MKLVALGTLSQENVASFCESKPHAVVELDFDEARALAPLLFDDVDIRAQCMPDTDLCARLKAAEARAERYEKCLRNLLPYLPPTSTGAEAIRAALPPQKDKTDDNV